MKKNVKTALITYGISFGLSGLLIWAYLAERDLLSASAQQRYRLLCDAFFIPAILFLMFGSLVWASSKGAMDGISFLVYHLVRAFVPGQRARTPQKYYDYVQERNTRRKTVSSYGFLFVTGCVCLAVSLIFLVLFYK